MIAYVNGEVIEKTAGTVVIDVMGVGYEIFTTAIDIDSAKVGEKRKF